MENIFITSVKEFDKAYSKKECIGNERHLWVCVRFLMWNKAYKELMDLVPTIDDVRLVTLIINFLGSCSFMKSIPDFTQFLVDFAKQSQQRFRDGLFIVQYVHSPDGNHYLELLDRNLDTVPIPETCVCKWNQKVVDKKGDTFPMNMSGIYEVCVGDIMIWRASHCI